MADNKNNPQQQQLTIELGEKEAEGIYSNLAVISHSAAEFVVDFTIAVYFQYISIHIFGEVFREHSKSGNFLKHGRGEVGGPPFPGYDIYI